MKIIPPHLWITSRVIANENRLRLLREIFISPRRSVGDLSECVELTLGSTSNQLKLLCGEGFITLHRFKKKVCYNDVIPYAPPHIKKIQISLKNELKPDTTLSFICKEATGTTHQRRIEIINRLNQAPRSLEQLLDETIMSYSALSRHLRKLHARNYISFSEGQYRIGTPSGALAKTLLTIIIDNT